jgi:hypothetical protein
MEDLTLDGVSVTTSGLSYSTYKAVACRLLLNVTQDNLDAAIDTFRQAGFAGPYSGLNISGVRDLSFLEEFPNTLYLQVNGDKPVKADTLASLSNLRGLLFESPGSGIDFSWFPHIEVYTGGWHKGHINVDQCPSLRHLGLRSFNPKSGDLRPLSNCRRLESLYIGRSTITSLDGIETLEDLRTLDIAYMSKLESLDAFRKCESGLRILGIERARNIQSYLPIAALTRLKDLRLFGCPPMQDLKWTKGMNWLEHFSFVETNVIDGDLEPLLELERLSYIGTEDKRHYNHKMHDFIEMLANR